jgi:hypothetical protein
MPDDDLYASDVCCPACGNIMDAYSLFVEEGTASEGSTACLHCHEDIADEDWITD